MTQEQLTLRPEPSERSLAAVMHGGTIVAPILVPLAAYVWLRKRSRFVAAHALQSLLETLLLNALILIVGLASLCYTVYRLVNYYQNDWEGFSIWEFLVRFAIGWILLALLGVINTVVAVLQAYGAYQGRWPKSKRVIRWVQAENTRVLGAEN